MHERSYHLMSICCILSLCSLFIYIIQISLYNHSSMGVIISTIPMNFLILEVVKTMSIIGLVSVLFAG